MPSANGPEPLPALVNPCDSPTPELAQAPLGLLALHSARELLTSVYYVWEQVSSSHAFLNPNCKLAP